MSVVLLEHGWAVEGHQSPELVRNWGLGLPQSYVFTRYLGGDHTVA